MTQNKEFLKYLLPAKVSDIKCSAEECLFVMASMRSTSRSDQWVIKLSLIGQRKIFSCADLPREGLNHIYLGLSL